jgi:hypothetical protein
MTLRSRCAAHTCCCGLPSCRARTLRATIDSHLRRRLTQSETRHTYYRYLEGQPKEYLYQSNLRAELDSLIDPIFTSWLEMAEHDKITAEGVLASPILERRCQELSTRFSKQLWKLERLLGGLVDEYHLHVIIILIIGTLD